MAPTQIQPSGEKESFEQDGESPEKEKESSDKKEEISGTEEESNPGKWTTMPFIGFLLALNTTWLIWPRLKAIGGKYNLLYYFFVIALSGLIRFVNYHFMWVITMYQRFRFLGRMLGRTS